MLGDVSRLRSLRVVAEHRSFSRAAEELGYTQSAVSQQIAALEHEVGLTLLNRAVRPVELTDAGRVLAGHAESVFEHLATAEAQLDALRGLRAGRLRLAAFGSAYATFLPRAIAEFRDRHPDVQLELVEAEPDVSLPLLRRGEVDLAILYRLGTDGGDDGVGGPLDAAYLLDDEHRAVLPARHRLAARDAVTVSDLAEEAWIVPRPGGPARGYREGLERLCADAGFAPRVAFETDDLQAVQTFVAAGLGIALMHDLTMPTRRRSIAVRPISGPRLTRPVHAVTAAGRRSPPATAMLDVLTQPLGSPR
jgi:DNA-binding transcriptional LysR family regulator